MAISVYCNCGNALQVSAELAGRKIRCKACGEVLRIPAVPLGESAEEESARDEYEVVGEQATSRTCPSCGATASVEDTACLACGAPLGPDLSLGPLDAVPRPVLVGGLAVVALLVVVGLLRWAWISTRPGAHVGDGLALLNAGDPRGAEREFKAALDYDPRHGDAVVGLAKVGVAAKDGSLLRRYAPDAIELIVDGEERAAVQIAFAWSLLSDRDAGRAAEQAERAHQSDPRLEAEAQAVLGLVALQEGDAERAFEHLEQAQRGRFKDVRVSRALAELYRDRGRTVDARTAVEEAVSLARDDIELWLLVADLRRATGDRDAERQALGEAIRLDPHRAESRSRMAEALLAAERLDAALEEAREAASLAPGSQAARVAVGRILLARGEAQAAREQLEEAVKLGTDWEAEFLLGEALVLTGQVPQGLQRIQSALARERERTDAHIAAARLAMEHDEVQIAAKVLGRALEGAPEHYDARVLLAEALAKAPLGRRRHDEAIRDNLGQAIRVAPARREAPLALGLHLFETLRPEEAMDAFAKGLEHHPRDAELLYYKGWAAIRARAWDPAIDALEACKRVDSTFRDVDDKLLQAREGKFYERR